jgi:hypothetical protein
MTETEALALLTDPLRLASLALVVAYYGGRKALYEWRKHQAKQRIRARLRALELPIA